MDADSAAAFERLTKRLDYPMVVLTVAADGETSGCLVGFSTQCSINPPRYLVCLSVKNHTHALASRAPTAAVHFLGAEPHGLAALFGALIGDDVDKLARVPGDRARAVRRCWTTYRTGSPERWSRATTSATTPGWSSR